MQNKKNQEIAFHGTVVLPGHNALWIFVVCKKKNLVLKIRVHTWSQNTLACKEFLSHPLAHLRICEEGGVN